ncbi:hypothetical protein [Ancylomarina longa]|uniref:Outer membrane protein beta-barrel domain-containing protein n=1 Tax=Ancylomarina longa TaxID=2487017 RepID=A0A434AUN0_9BACT|nr:hypothetical protein [Ancylomarina longa]RUT78170.1 hypothetical protein DLK05_10010 [Ancylomarina longa]
MKRLLIVLIMICGAGIVNAQVFNTSGILKGGDVAIGFEPSLLVYDGTTDAQMFFHAGVGLGRNMDLGAKIGAFGEETYYGGDLEFGISKNLSLSAGAHHFHDFGLDGTANVSIPLVSGTKLITGLDMDINFGETTKIPLWVPVGIRVAVGNGWSMIMEAEIELTNEAYHYFGIGMAYGF